MEMDAAMRNSIPRFERNDHLRASIHTLWAQLATKASLWCISCGNWCHSISRDEWWVWVSHCICFQDKHKNRERASANWQRSFGDNLGSQKIPCVFVWAIVHPVDKSSATHIHLPSTEEHSSGYSSQTSAFSLFLYIASWLWLQNRLQEH